MKITVITATWNSGKTISDTLESVLNQCYEDFEHIIVDGSSSDDTLEIVKRYEPRYRGRLKWISEPDKGIYDAMNKGIKMATGDVIGCLNSDDFYASSNVLSEIANGLKSADIVFGDLVFVDSKDTSRIVRQWKGSPYTLGAFFNGWHPAHPTFYAKKYCFDQCGGFDCTFDVSADFELMLRFIEKAQYRTAYLPVVMVKMRMGGESTGSISKIIQGNKNVLRAFRKNGFKVQRFYLIRRLAPKALNIIRNKLNI